MKPILGNHLCSAALVLASLAWTSTCMAAGGADRVRKDYLEPVRVCLETLMAHGTDRYGSRHAPILVSILDVETRECPADPQALDEKWRVTRRERRNPAGANLLTDQPLLKTMYALSEQSGDDRYARFADGYVRWYLSNLVDEKGFIWWGWHRHYDVFTEEMTGHQGNHHEIHSIHEIAWDRLWRVDPAATRREIEAIWRWHVIDKETGEINRHGDGQRGCDFAMSAGACAQAFAFLYQQTKEPQWLERARLLARYYWERRHPETGLFADRPNAGKERFDGAHFLTSGAGLYCHALFKCSDLTGDAQFREQAVAYLKAYRKHGFDASAGRFWGSLKLDGTPVPGPRIAVARAASSYDYAAYEPRGHLDLWQPYAAGYEHGIAAAQMYAYAGLTTHDMELGATAHLFGRCLMEHPPRSGCEAETWYRGYAEEYAPKGTYAGLYGQAISFFVQLHQLAGERRYLEEAVRLADEAVARLFHNGLFRGHPAKPYYEAMDGVGHLLYALLSLDRVQHGATPPEWDNW